MLTHLRLRDANKEIGERELRLAREGTKSAVQVCNQIECNAHPGTCRHTIDCNERQH